MGQRGTPRNAHRTALEVDFLVTPKLPSAVWTPSAADG